MEGAPRSRYPIGLALCVACLVTAVAVSWVTRLSDPTPARQFASSPLNVIVTVVFVALACSAALRQFAGVAFLTGWFALVAVSNWFHLVEDLTRSGFGTRFNFTLLSAAWSTLGAIYLLGNFRRLVRPRAAPAPAMPS